MDNPDQRRILALLSLVLNSDSVTVTTENTGGENKTEPVRIAHIRKNLRELQKSKREEMIQDLKKKFIESCNICLGEITLQDNLMCIRCTKLFCKTCLQVHLKSSKQCPNCRHDMKLSDIAINRSYKKMVETLDLLETKDQASIYGDTHSENSKMFCKDCDVVICQSCIIEKAHREHEITNLPEKLEILKYDIFEWKEKTANLHSFGTAKVEELTKLKTPTVEQLFEFRNALLKSLRDEIDAIIDNHRQTLPSINYLCQKANEFTKCGAEQQELLGQKEQLVGTAQSYTDLKKYIDFIKEREFAEGKIIERGDYKKEINEYLTLTEDKQIELENSFTQDLTVDKNFEKLRWPATKDLLEKLTKVMETTSETYLKFDP